MSSVGESFFDGMKSGYQFVDDIKKSDEERERKKQDQAFAEQTRDQQRAQYARDNEYQAGLKAKQDAWDKQFAPQPQATPSDGQATPVAPVGGLTAPSDAAVPADGPVVSAVPAPVMPVDITGAPKPVVAAGIPSSTPPTAPALGLQAQPQASQSAPQQPAKPTIDQLYAHMQDVMAYKLGHDRMDLPTFEAARKVIDTAKTEGVSQGFNFIQQGRFNDGIDSMNKTGTPNAIHFKNNELPVKTTVKIAGVEVPTYVGTMVHPDGSEMPFNTALILHEQAGLEKQLAKAQTAQEIDIKRQKENTTEQWRKDEATNAAERNRILGLKGSETGTAPLWNDKGDALVEKAATVTDPMGNKSIDTGRALFIKNLGVGYSNDNGGDMFSAINKAQGEDDELVKLANGDAGKLNQYRSEAIKRADLRRKAMAARASAPLQNTAAPQTPTPSKGAVPASAEFNTASAQSRGNQAANDVSARKIKADELDAEISRPLNPNDPGDSQRKEQTIAALSREIAAMDAKSPPVQQQMQAVDAPVAAPVPAPVPAPTQTAQQRLSAPVGGLRPPALPQKQPTYKAWLAAKEKIDQLKSNAAAMKSPEAGKFYLDARLPDAEADLNFNEKYPRY